MLWTTRDGRRLTEQDVEDAFNESLDDGQPDGVSVGPYTFRASLVLARTDPAAYRTELLAMVDRLERAGYLMPVTD